MKLSYFNLLSPAPIQLQNIGGIISPTLRDISLLGYDTYQYYLTILSMDLKTYLTIIGCPEKYDLLSDKEKTQMSIFDLLISNTQSCTLLQNILNFFIREDIKYSPVNNGFIVRDNDKDIGIITKDNYHLICDVICQRNCIKLSKQEDLSKVKSKKALEIMKKLQQKRAEKSKQTKTDKNMELGNIISAVANKSNSLNILNIWDLTIFQIWDCFSRLSNNNIYAIQSMSVAAWGNKDNYFDAGSWFKRIGMEEYYAEFN